MEKQRIVSLDYMRAFACLFVILTHSNEPFYMGADNMVQIASHSDLVWISILDGISRLATVPLFVLISSYLLLPLNRPTGEFFKRRFKRVVIPFVIWIVLYATLPALWGDFPVSDIPGNLKHILFNFTDNAGHLWFVYMLIGMYLFIPVISPWLDKVSKKGEQAFLGVWFFTTLFPYLRLISPELYGESYWNEFGMFWNFSGYIGYMVLAHYIKKYVDWSTAKAVKICVPTIILGTLATISIFYFNTPHCETVPETELPWFHCSTIIAVTNAATFVLMLQIKKGTGLFYALVKEISSLSYGMYLMHLLLLNAYHTVFAAMFSCPIAVLLTAIYTYVTAFALTKIISLIPGGKYITG